MNFLEKALLPSNSAVLFRGPKILSPCALKSSTIPSTKGASGPTIVKSILSLMAKFLKLSTPSSYTFCPSFAVVALPFAKYILVILRSPLSFVAIADSLAPFPTINIFICFLYCFLKVKCYRLFLFVFDSKFR